MTALSQRVSRWEPVADIPDSPCGDFKLESCEAGNATLTLRYSWVVGNDADLVLSFSEVNAIRTFWDGDGDGVKSDGEPPRCSGVHAGYIWPLLLVEPSAWLRSGAFDTSLFIAESMNREPWRHYRVITLERSVDILARGTILGHWIAASA
jgi:hypothetical protein